VNWGRAGVEEGLVSAPGGFFMTLRDVAFWLRSSRVDGRISRDRDEYGMAVAFDRLYSAETDPFGAELPQFRYQRRKYDCLLSMLPRRRYRNVLDVGCGLGAFTRRLAPFSEAILGIDISEAAIAQARQRSLGRPNIRYAVGAVLGAPAAEEKFDLIVLADVLYYMDTRHEDGVESIAAGLASRLLPDGLVLLVNHYFFGIDAASRTTRAIHDAFRNSPLLVRQAEYRRAFFLTTILQRVDESSITTTSQ
jgi:2-polyprenyl-3-methyl-5-hydroxy-6-metoxy-1,4-benzoquinol methylase